ncbi:MAG TPA: hypothetical protein VNY08_08465 [Bradyrhizobium sp.]|nr:hypothetical protein [Bradyrhizobium sp.]
MARGDRHHRALCRRGVDAIRALGVEGWVRKSNTLARFPAGFDPAFADWYA